MKVFEENLKALATEALNRKYGESFMACDMAGPGLDSPYALLHFVSESHPEARFAVYAYKEDGKLVFDDAYYGVLVYPEVRALLSKKAAILGPAASVFCRFTADSFRPSFTRDTALVDALKLAPESLRLNIHVFTDTLPQKADFDDFAEAVRAAGILGYAALYVVPEPGSYTETTWQQAFSSRVKAAFSTVIRKEVTHGAVG